MSAGKKAKKWKTEEVPVTPDFAASLLRKAGCGWRGCKDTVDATAPTLPAGWKHIVVAGGSLSETENLLAADVDGLLCPHHYRELLGSLKIGPQRLQEMGEAAD